jgi:dolichol-phosphate mannosyltransferase
MKLTDGLTIIVPVFNEEESLPSFFQEIDQFVTVSPIKTIILFVNDGSIDNSETLLIKQCANHHAFQYISLDRNYGLSTAIKAGIDVTSTELAGYIDADLQTDPKDFLKYLDHFPEVEMVNGIRRKRKDSIQKKLSSHVANAYRRFMINDGIEDTCCPLKIMKTTAAKAVPFFDGMHRFLPALVKMQGGIVKQVPISHRPRKFGTSKYHIWNRLFRPFMDTLAFRWMQSRYINYRINKT